MILAWPVHNTESGTWVGCFRVICLTWLDLAEDGKLKDVPSSGELFCNHMGCRIIVIAPLMLKYSAQTNQTEKSECARNELRNNGGWNRYH